MLLQVGASNELPESEELDALYDRFLIRRQVSQVSDIGLPAMLAAAADNNLAVSVATHMSCCPLLLQAISQITSELTNLITKRCICIALVVHGQIGLRSMRQLFMHHSCILPNQLSDSQQCSHSIL